MQSQFHLHIREDRLGTKRFSDSSLREKCEARLRPQAEDFQSNRSPFLFDSRRSKPQLDLTISGGPRGRCATHRPTELKAETRAFLPSGVRSQPTFSIVPERV